MKSIHLFFLSLIIIFGMSTQAQEQVESISLAECLSLSASNYPLSKQKWMIDSISSLKMDNLNINYLPRIDLNGQMTYQSDVVELPLNIPGIPLNIDPMRKDQYKVTLDINETIYDAGITSVEKELERINRTAEQKSIETDLYKLKERVIQVYFSAIISNEQLKILTSKEDQLNIRISTIESKVRNGVLLASNQYLLEAELIKLNQQIEDLQYSRKAALKILGIYTGVNVTEQTDLQLPDDPDIPDEYQIFRPEYQLFDLQLSKLQSLEKLSKTRTLPRVSGFGQLGYGAPGLNFLSNNFEAFYIIGARISWKPWNWNETRNSRKSLHIQTDVIKSQKDTYDQNLRINIENISSQINKYESLIVSDQELIILREKITQISSAQLTSGTITSSDYLNDLNEEIIAKINLINHQIMLANSKINYQTALGKL